MTGGSHYSDSKNKVHLYDEYGWIGDLPDLRHNREDHGCGYYMNTDNKMVDIIIHQLPVERKDGKVNLRLKVKERRREPLAADERNKRQTRYLGRMRERERGARERYIYIERERAPKNGR